MQKSSCWLCQKEITIDEKENPVVKHHGYLTGKIRGLAHDKCNLKARKKTASVVPILFHNFSGYDCHLIYEKLINIAIEKSIEIEDDIMPKSSEKNISVKIGCLKLLDFSDF